MKLQTVASILALPFAVAACGPTILVGPPTVRECEFVRQASGELTRIGWAGSLVSPHVSSSRNGPREAEMVLSLVENTGSLGLRVNAFWPISDGAVVSVGDEGRFMLASGDVILLNATEFSVADGDFSRLGNGLTIEYGADEVVLEALAESRVVGVKLAVGQARLERQVNRRTGEHFQSIARCFLRTPAGSSP